MATNDANLHRYLELSLKSLLPEHADLGEALQQPDVNLALLGEIHDSIKLHAVPFNMMRHLNSLPDALAVRRAYFWLQRYCTDPKLQYFLLQHPSSKDFSYPFEVFGFMQDLENSYFAHQVKQQFNKVSDEIKEELRPFGNTFKVLDDTRIAPWWEDEYALTRQEIDTLVGYLRLALR